MNPNDDRTRSCSKHIVLIGVGHTNAHIVRQWGMNPIPDTDLTCVSDFPIATYSGMMPAVLAQQISPSEMQIDLVRLCASVGARLICGKVTGVDHDRNEVHLEDRPPLAFDALSIGMGSIPTTQGVEIQGNSLIKIKPMQTFLDRLAAKIHDWQRSNESSCLKIAIVGSGVAGVEISLCLKAFLAKHTDRPIQQRIVTRSEQILPDVADAMRAKAIAKLRSRQTQITTGQSVVAVADRYITLADGSSIETDIVIWATGASAPDALGRFGLPTDNRGFLTTDATLRSTSGKPCFAVGDSGTIVGESLAKAGVYAVRQGPILWQNLHRLLSNRELKRYRPQRSFLKLLNCGDGSAIAQWKGISFAGSVAMRLKHRIDSKFMQMYRPPAMDIGGEIDVQMQCRGCGCKLGADPLANAIAMIGGDGIELEDASLVGETNEAKLLASTDFFTMPFDDAYLSGRVAALHSASDIIASGGLPTHALATVVLADGDVETQQRTLADFLSGARREFEPMGARIVGGHTIVGPRMEAGFTVIGSTAGDMLRKRNLQVGDVICVTKPLGIGVLLAAHMQAACLAAEYLDVVDTMLAAQHGYVAVANAFELTAMTDVTGFGLAGHLVEMLQESNVSAELSLDRIPMIQGAQRVLHAGIRSTLAPENRRFGRWITVDDKLRDEAAYQVLFDPQTCGGLLFGIAADRLESFNQAIKNANLPAVMPIANVVASDKATLTVTA